MKKLILSTFIAISSINASADTQLFRTKIYEAQEILPVPKFGAFREAVGRLNIARELTENAIAQQEVISAIGVLTDRNLDDSDRIKKTNEHLESALRNERVKIKGEKTLAGESLEALLMATMFGDVSEKIQIRSEKHGKEQLLTLLATYLADARAAKFDPDVRDLVENKEVSFILPPEKIPLSEGIDKKIFVAELKDQVKGMVSDDLPISFKVSTSKTGEVMIEIEMKGLDAVSFVETWVRNPLMLANGNRYIFSVANGIESLSTSIKSQYLGHNTTIQKLANSLATKLLDPAEDILRNKLISEKWSPESVEIVKKQIEQATSITIAHMKKNLDRTLEKLNSALGTEQEIAAAKARTEGWIKNAEEKLKASMQNIDNAVAELQKTEGYMKASTAEKSAMRVAAAEKAGNTKLWSWRRCLVYVSAALSTYYIYQWSVQTYRNDDPKAQQAINEKYGVKLINTMLYFVPAVGELAFAIDFLGNWAMNFVLKTAEFQLRIPSVENLLHMGIDGLVKVALELRGIREFDILKHETQLALKISPFKDGKGLWWDADIVKKASELKDSASFTAEAKQLELNKTVKKSAYKYLTLYYTLNSRFPDEQENLGKFYEDILSQWKNTDSNFVTSGMSLL